MNNTTIIDIFKSGNSSIANIKTQDYQIMTIITNIILKFEPMIKIPLVTNHVDFLVVTLTGSIPSLISILL